VYVFHRKLWKRLRLKLRHESILGQPHELLPEHAKRVLGSRRDLGQLIQLLPNANFER